MNETQYKVGDLVRMDISKTPGTGVFKEIDLLIDRSTYHSKLKEFSNRYGIGIVVGFQPPAGAYTYTRVNVYWTRGRCERSCSPSLLVLVSGGRNHQREAVLPKAIVPRTQQ